MELHNVIEDIVIPGVEEIFDALEKSGNEEKFCTCEQCRIDTACYVLNRIEPYYLVSNRGAARVQQETLERRQREVEITSLIYQGLRQVNHNQRPNAAHYFQGKSGAAYSSQPVFNIPSIAGRLLSGSNFAPITGLKIKLLRNGALVEMKDRNWQNPLQLDSHADSNFSFWPVPVPAEKIGEQGAFEFTLWAEAEEYEPLIHVIKISLESEEQTAKSFNLNRTHKLPNLFMFPPGGEEGNRYLD